MKKANVSYALGVNGTDIAKEASDIILLDNKFSSIIKSIIFGKQIYDSVKKMLQFTLTLNIVVCLLTLIGIITIK